MIKSHTLLSDRTRSAPVPPYKSPVETLTEGKWVLTLDFEYNRLTSLVTFGKLGLLFESESMQEEIYNQAKLAWARTFNQVMIDWQKKLSEHDSVVMHNASIEYDNVVVNAETGEQNLPYPKSVTFKFEVFSVIGVVLLLSTLVGIMYAVGIPGPLGAVLDRVDQKTWGDEEQGNALGLSLPSFWTTVTFLLLALGVYLVGSGAVKVKGALS